VTKAVGANVGEPASELMKSITPANVQSWTQTEPKDWANEPFAFAEQAQTKYCTRQGRLATSQREGDDRRRLCASERADRPRAAAESRCQGRAYARCRFGEVTPAYRRPQCRGFFFAGVLMAKEAPSKFVAKSGSGEWNGQDGASINPSSRSIFATAMRRSSPSQHAPVANTTEPLAPFI
jgi:hypothetical protein